MAGTHDDRAASPAVLGSPRWLSGLVAGAALVLLLAPSALGQVRQGSGSFGGSAKPPAQDDPLLFHVLRRTSFGPTAASIAEIRALGVDEYLWRQLHPETIDDSALESQLAAELPPVDDVTYNWPDFRHEYLRRAAFSQRQLEAVMTQFWENHFDTVVPYGNNEPEQHAWTDMERTEDSLFRRLAFGRFRDLLEVSAKSQAMMYFLDNYTNNVASGNENYARELLELHSLSVDCGYDQQDVQEVARIWTGWTGVYLVRDPSDPTLIKQDIDGDGEDDFVFNPRAHEFTATQTLGQSFPAGQGLAEGERVLDIVSSHPCTARFLSRKLLQLFVTDAPSDDLVDRIATVFLDTDGDVREVLWAIFHTPEFRDPVLFGGKVRTPLEFTLASLRASNGGMGLGQGRDYDLLESYYYIRNMGMDLFNFNIPTGYAEVAPPWVTANGFLQRWKFADSLMQWAPSATRPTWSNPMPLVQQVGLAHADEVVDYFTRLLIGTTLDGARKDRLREILLQGLPDFDPANGAQEGRLREMIANILGSPEFPKQ